MKSNKIEREMESAGMEEQQLISGGGLVLDQEWERWTDMETGEQMVSVHFGMLVNDIWEKEVVSFPAKIEKKATDPEWTKVTAIETGEIFWLKDEDEEVWNEEVLI